MKELTDTELIQMALNYWANYLETSDVTLSAIDAANSDRKFNALTLEQMKVVVRLRELSMQMGS